MVSITGILGWLAGTRAGRLVAAAGAAALGILAIYGKGRRDARTAQEHEALENYADTRRRADEALKRAEGNTTAPDERLKQHGRLRDDRLSRDGLVRE